MDRAVLYRATTWLRTRVGQAVLVGLLIALVLTPAFVLFAGARRTSSAPARYTAAQSIAFDVHVDQSDGYPLTDEIAALPGVRSVAFATFMFGALIAEGATTPVDALTFAGQADALTVQVVTGREPAPSAPGEFVASETWVALTGATLGDAFTLQTISQAEAARRGYAGAFDGPTTTATLVGIFDDRVQDLNSSYPVALFGRGLLDAYQEPSIGLSGSAGVIATAPGVDGEELRRELDTLPDGSALSIRPLALIEDPLVSAVSTQSSALGVLSVIVASAAAVVLVQLLVRLFRTSDTDLTTLASLGYTNRQAMLEIVLRAALPVAAGVCLAGVAAWLLSGLFPYGFARVLEPTPGPRFDGTVHLAIAGAAAIVLLTAAAVFARPRSTRMTHRRSVDRLASRIPVPTVATGARLAFGRSRRSGPTDALVAGLAAVAAVTIAALTVWSSLDRMLDTPSNWGDSYDASYGEGGESVDPQVLDVLRADPAVRAVTLYGATTVAIGSDALGVVAFSPVEGSEVPEVLLGRLPQGSDELALGTRAAKRFGVTVGDRLSVSAPSGAVELAVVGLAVFPGFDESDSLGNAALVNEAGLLHLDPTDALSGAAIYWADGARPDAAEQLSAALGGASIGPPSRPDAVVTLDRIRNVPLVVVGVVGALLVLSLGQLIATAVRRRRPDLAVLRALGATTRWSRRVAQWQATVLALTAVAFAIPVGIVAGRVVYRTYPEQIGAPLHPDIPVQWIILMIAAVIVAANVVAIVAARRLRSTTQELGTE